MTTLYLERIFTKISHETSGIGNLPNNFPRKEIADKKVGYNFPLKKKKRLVTISPDS